MKKFKKLASTMLALVMALTMTLSLVSADETTPTKYSITINNSAEGHTYEAYQIFTGDLPAYTQT